MRRQPIPDTHSKYIGALHPANAGGEFRAERTAVSRSRKQDAQPQRPRPPDLHATSKDLFRCGSFLHANYDSMTGLESAGILDKGQIVGGAQRPMRLRIEVDAG